MLITGKWNGGKQGKLAKIVREPGTDHYSNFSGTDHSSNFSGTDY